MYSYKTGLGQVWVGSKLPPNPANNIIWLRPSDDHRVLWEIRTYNIYKEKWEVLTSAALTAEGLLVLIRDLEKDVKSLQELKAVLYDTVQNLTPEQQQIARQNIGAVSLEDLPLDENVTRLAIELTINDENVYSVVTPLETLTEHYRKFLADPTKYVWQLYLKVGEDQLGLVPLFIINYGGLHIGFYSPDMSGETKYVSLNTNGDVVIRATVNNYGPTLVEVVQSTGDSVEKVMSQKTVTEELRKKASMASVTEGISAHNTSSTSHADIRELLNTCVGLPAYDSSSYKITFTTLAGANVEIDLPIEQLALRYNPETESIEFDNADGTTTSIPVSAFVKEYVGSIGDRIQISIDENNAIHATVLNNSIDWDCLSVELQERINDHVTSVDFATKVVRTDIAQSLSLAAQNQALENIGADLMIIDLVNGQATLTDEQETRLLSCKGVILRGTVNAGKEVLTKIYFSDYQGGDQVSFWAVRNNEYILQCVYTKSTKLFRFLTSAGFIDRNAVSIKKQTLNAAEQMQAFANLGMKLYVTDSSFLGSTLSAEEIEEVFVSKAILFADTGDLFSFGAASSSQIYFYKFINRSSIGYITLNKPSGSVSNGYFDYQDTKALHFTAQNPALTSAQQAQAFENLGWKVHVISESAIGSSDAVSDDEKAARLSATALLVQETGEMYLYGHDSTSTPSDLCFYRFRDTKTLALLNVVTTTGLITQPPFVNIYDENAVSFTINQSGVSNARKNNALGNIGIDLVRIPHSLLGTTLSDEMANVINNARGIILVDTPSDYSNPTVFVKGNNTSGSCIFVAFVTGNTYCIFTLNKSTKLLSGISSGLSYGGSVRYAEEQSLTNTQKDTVLSNIGLNWIHVPYSLLGTTLDDETYTKLTNAYGIILADVPSDYIGPIEFLRGTLTPDICIFSNSYTSTTSARITIFSNNKRIQGVSYSRTYEGAVPYDASITLTSAKQDVALSNIGLDFVHVDYSLFNTTLSDADFNRIWNAKGLIIVGNNEIAPVMLKGRSSLSQVAFYSIRDSSTLVYTVLLASTKRLNGLTSWSFNEGAVQYNVAQNLTDAQKDTALSNIGLNFINVDYSLLGTTLDDSTAALVENANGIILTNTPENYSKASVFLKSIYSNDLIYFNAWNGVSLVSQFYYNTSTKKLTAISNTDLYFDSIRYGVSQNLTNTQKQQARTNIDAVGSSGIKRVEIVYSTAPMQQDNILYIELEETT